MGDGLGIAPDHPVQIYPITAWVRRQASNTQQTMSLSATTRLLSLLSVGDAFTRCQKKAAHALWLKRSLKKCNFRSVSRPVCSQLKWLRYQCKWDLHCSANSQTIARYAKEIVNSVNRLLPIMSINISGRKPIASVSHPYFVFGFPSHTAS